VGQQKSACQSNSRLGRTMRHRRLPPQARALHFGGAVMANSWSVDNAVAQFFEDGFKDGDLISRDWILYALDLSEVRTNEDSLRLLDRMESFRKALLED